MNDEERVLPASMSAGNPRICVANGIVYMAPWGYTPLGMNGFGEMIASNGSDVYVMPRLGRQVTSEDDDK
jgi:hypothetical protein